MNKILITFIVLLVSTSNIYSQEKLIKGRVISEHLENLPFVSIMINDTIEVGKTDANGHFYVIIPVSEQKIVLVFLGLEVTNISLQDKCNDLEVIMMDAVTYDFIPLKKVDKRRRKSFNRLPRLHKEAFEKGIFKTENVCYIQDFLPYYKRK